MRRNIPSTTAYGLFISQFTIFLRACASCQEFNDVGLLLTRELLKRLNKFSVKKLSHHFCLPSPIGWPVRKKPFTNSNEYFPTVVISNPLLYLLWQTNINLKKHKFWLLNITTGGTRGAGDAKPGYLNLLF